MRRPSEVELPGVIELTDDAAPDFIEAHHVSLVAFAELDTAPSILLRGRLSIVVARRAEPTKPTDLGIGVVDIAKHTRVAEALGIKSTPAVVVFVDGEVHDRLMGVVPESVLDEVVQSRLAQPADDET